MKYFEVPSEIKLLGYCTRYRKLAFELETKLKLAPLFVERAMQVLALDVPVVSYRYRATTEVAVEAIIGEYVFTLLVNVMSVSVNDKPLLLDLATLISRSAVVVPVPRLKAMKTLLPEKAS
jgi:hypothetical protein